jgi:cystathionine beta-lyase
MKKDKNPPRLSEAGDFDVIYNRAGTGSLKYDKYKGRDIIPMWVADMDFESPEAVKKALHKRIDHGIFGYSVPTSQINSLAAERLKKLYNWQIQPDWVVWLQGLVLAINIISHYIKEDEEIITFVPAYPPFLDSPKSAGRKVIKVPLIFRNGRYTFDLQKFEKSITPKTRLLILCNPHNPTGRVYDKDELQAVADICLKHNIIVCSDEIHCELILCDKKHIPFAALSSEIADKTITLMSPSKTFNLSGLNCGFAVISNPQIRRQFLKVMAGIAPPCVNALGLVACQAAFTGCDDWKESLLDYLKENKRIVYDFVNNQLSPLSMTDIEATYLAWIDVRGLKISDPVSFFEQAGVGLSDGKEFGAEGFIRLNFGCPRPLLLKALNRMKQAIDKHLL